MATLIINSGRCSHGRCFFCGYGRIRGFEPTGRNVDECLDRFFAGLKGDEVKVFGSGSFLDDRQIPKASRQRFIEECRKRGVKRITLESRPEFVHADALKEFKGLDVTIAMGLESADEKVLKRLNKGYGRREYEEAAGKIHDSGFKVRTYLLVNPPFVDELKKSLDASVEYALNHSDSVVLINMLPHANAPLTRMWLSGEWNYLAKREFMDVIGRWKDDPRIDFDQETFRFVPSFPDELKERLEGVGEWHLTHPHFEVWQDYLVRWYAPPQGRILLFLPCANRKPYSLSRTHQGFIAALNEAGRGGFHEVMLSNAGLIPREFEDRYPFESYDWDETLETPQIKERYIEVTADRIRKYLATHSGGYSAVACFLKYDSESYKALKKACNGLGIEFKNLLSKETYGRIKDGPRPLQTEEALKDLSEGLKSLK
ncbi:MAG: DUF5591 domain-containing protein [Candidatus Altiarchaeota archaeon]